MTCFRTGPGTTGRMPATYRGRRGESNQVIARVRQEVAGDEDGARAVVLLVGSRAAAHQLQGVHRQQSPDNPAKGGVEERCDKVGSLASAPRIALFILAKCLRPVSVTSKAFQLLVNNFTGPSPSLPGPYIRLSSQSSSFRWAAAAFGCRVPGPLRSCSSWRTAVAS